MTTVEVMYSTTDIQNVVSVGNTIRFLGEDYTVTGVYGQGVISINETFTSAFGSHVGPARYATPLSSAFTPRAVASYQGRIAFGGFGVLGFC